MNLTVDIGNTLIKIAVFDKAKLMDKRTVQHLDFEKTIKNLKAEYPKIKQTIVSTVSNIQEEWLEDLILMKSTIVLDHMTPIPFKNLYGTPKTLGIDRIALVAAAVDQYPKQNVLIIDAGTCITYDFKNSKEEYLGGAIAPGIKLRYNSLNSYTANLPLLEPEFPNTYIGKNTNQSIHSGIMNGVICEMDGVIAAYCNTYPNLTVILTGGDLHFLSKRLKNSIFATSNFLLEGLNYILDFNNSQ